MKGMNIMTEIDIFAMDIKTIDGSAILNCINSIVDDENYSYGIETSKNEDTVVPQQVDSGNVEAFWTAANNGDALAAYRLRRYYQNYYSDKINSHSLNEDDLGIILTYADEGSITARYLIEFLLSSALQDNDEYAYEYRLKKIFRLADEGCAAALADRGYWGSYSMYGISKDVAISSLKMAASLKEPMAMCRLGELYFEGQMITKNEKEGTRLLNEAYNLGWTSAKDSLERLKSKAEEQKKAIENKQTQNSEGCYITTAVCEFQGKEDDCYELTMFRKFRDEWLVNEMDGKELIKEYYHTAPLIVETINTRTDRNAIYSTIWSRWLEPCLKDIEKKRYGECKQTYTEMVRHLEKLL